MLLPTVAALGAGGTLAAGQGSWVAAALLVVLAVVLATAAAAECAIATASALRAVRAGADDAEAETGGGVR